LSVLLRCTEPQEEFGDNKGVIRGRTPKNDRQKENEDTKGVLRGAIPKKAIHAKAQDYSFCILKLFLSVLRCTPLITLVVSSNSPCLSFFGVRTLITPFVSSNFACMAFFGPYTEEGHTRRV
jgi:hypothetical protein